MFRFLHAADIHLDSPLVGLDRYESAPVDAARGATRRAFENLVRLAIEEEVAFVVLAGDLYDGDWKDYRTGLFFVDQTARLREAGIQVFVVAGNHDAASQLTKNLRPPDNVHFFSTKKPETRLVEAFDVAIHGQGFSSRAVTEDLAAGYPIAEPGLFHIGMLHTSLEGREGHVTYAPTSARVLAQKGYQYWALGHVHKREVVAKDPWIVFPGNLQGRHAREVGAKGCSLVTVEHGAVVGVEERSVDVFRWAVCRVDVDGLATTVDVLDHISRALTAEGDHADGRAVATRVELTGSAACYEEISANPDHWVQEIRALATGVSSADVWVEKVRLAMSRPIDLAALAAREDAIGSFLRELAAVADSPEEIAALREALGEIRSVLPADLLSGDDAVDPHAPELLTRLVAEARDLLLARIGREEKAG
ncbi:MAG TPA: DNA repair exonuclease [Thermoanaerobaculia bacterium]|nr:DNA repair exonuclease [Thermoanaerobaculia bacterium]